MADVTYKVEIDLSTKGNLSQHLGGLHSNADALDSAFAKVGASASSIGSALEGVMERAASLVVTLGALGGIAIGGAVVHGVIHLNNELEKTQIALAGIFGANGVSQNVDQGMSIAADTMAQMRKDAAALPGETKDLVNIFKDISVPGFQAGASVDKLRDLSAKSMAAGATLGLPLDQMGREMAMLLEGRAGAHNVAGMRLAGLGGDKAEKFNKLSASDRVEYLSKKLDAYEPVIAKYSQSFDGVISTLKDSGKKLLGDFTLPLFERVKATAQTANQWFDTYGDTASRVASVWGSHLAAAFDVGMTKLGEWTPYILTFVSTLHDGLKRAWDSSSPLLTRLEQVAANFMTDPAAFDKIAGLVKAYAALKIGMPVAGAAMGMAGSAGKVGGMVAQMGGLSAEAGPIGLAVMVGVLETLAVAAVAAGGALSALTDGTSMMHDSAVRYWDGIFASMKTLEPAIAAVGAELKLSAEIFGTQMLGAIDSVLGAAIGATTALYDFGTGIGAFLADVQKTVNKLLGKDDAPKLNRDFEDAPYEARDVDVMSTTGAVAKGVAEGLSAAKAKTGGGGGGGGTHIAKVEITVTSNTDPSRIARLVYADLANLARHRTTSPDVRNFSAHRP